MGASKRHLGSSVRGFAVGIAVLGALLACRGSSSSKCDAAIELEGSRWSSIGTGSGPRAAEKSALTGSCIVYCDWGDPVVDAAYKRWKSTPKGASSKTRRSFNIFLYLKAEKQACNRRCLAAVTVGAVPKRVDCL